VPESELLPYLGHSFGTQTASRGSMNIARATVTLGVPMGRGLPPGQAGYIVRTAIARQQHLVDINHMMRESAIADILATLARPKSLC